MFFLQWKLHKIEVIVFKIDALLQNKADMKLIKNQNRKIAKEYTLDKQLSKVNEILKK